MMVSLLIIPRDRPQHTVFCVGMRENFLKYLITLVQFPRLIMVVSEFLLFIFLNPTDNDFYFPTKMTGFLVTTVIINII